MKAPLGAGPKYSWRRPALTIPKMPSASDPDPTVSPGRPLVIAHRGSSATHPENTLASFRAAAERGADLVELDARVTADGVPLVLHDPDLARTTDRTGAVHELTLDQVRAARTEGGEAVPTLAEVLEALAPTGVGVDVEIKNLPGEPSYDTPRESVLIATVELLAETAFPNPVLVSSFNPATVRRCRDLAPDLPTGLLTFASLDLDAAVRVAQEAGHRWILPHAIPLVEAGEGFVEEAHGRGLLVGTWTVDEPAAIAACFARGVDAVATNDPAMAVEVRDRLGRGHA